MVGARDSSGYRPQNDRSAGPAKKRRDSLRLQVIQLRVGLTELQGESILLMVAGVTRGLQGKRGTTAGDGVRSSPA